MVVFLLPCLFFMLTEYIFKTGHWGAIYWLLAVVSIFIGQITGGNILKSNTQQAKKQWNISKNRQLISGKKPDCSFNIILKQ
jgi:hypothetical protein